MKAIHSSHDTFAKRCLTDLSIAKDFLKAHLPESIKARCDFATLKIEPTSYIEEDLRQHTTDILYSLRIAETEGFIYCLIENQSKPERMMPLRFWRYQASILKHFAANRKNLKQKLPVIVPLLFYTGIRSPYPYSLNLADCFQDTALAKQLLSQPVQLIDLSCLCDDEIKKHGKATVLEWVQKHIHYRDSIKLAYEFAAILRQLRISRDLFTDVLKYMLFEGDKQNTQGFLKVIIEQTEYRREAMTMAEEIENWGIQKGIQLGKQEGKLEEARLIAKNLLSKGLEWSVVKEATGLSDEELNQLLSPH